MKYHLDSNAWIAAFKNTGLYSDVLEAHTSGILEIEVTNQVRDELTGETKIKKKGVIARNRELLQPFSREIELDSIFILGVSRLGEARLGDDEVSSTYSRHLEAKSLNLNNMRDGIHLANALYAKATLVTCDRQLQISASKFGVQYMCLGEFCESQKWDHIQPCIGCL